MIGASAFALGGSYPLTYGLGARADFWLSSGETHGWVLSPGLSSTYVPRQDDDSAFESDSLSTPVVAVIPNVDLRYITRVSEHLDLVFGARLGLAVAVSGHDLLGNAVAGDTKPDVDVFVGFRF